MLQRHTAKHNYMLLCLSSARFSSDFITCLKIILSNSSWILVAQNGEQQAFSTYSLTGFSLICCQRPVCNVPLLFVFWCCSSGLRLILPSFWFSRYLHYRQKKEKKRHSIWVLVLLGRKPFSGSRKQLQLQNHRTHFPNGCILGLHNSLVDLFHRPILPSSILQGLSKLW